MIQLLEQMKKTDWNGRVELTWDGGKNIIVLEHQSPPPGTVRDGRKRRRQRTDLMEQGIDHHDFVPPGGRRVWS